MMKKANAKNEEWLLSKSSDYVFFEHDLENTEVWFPMPLYALLAVLFQTLLPGVDLDQGREPSQRVLQLSSFLRSLKLEASKLNLLY